MIELKAALSAALRQAVVRNHPESEEPYHTILIDDVVRRFKKLWLYADEETLRLPSENTSASHVIVFHRNLNVTNICRSELACLLRRHTRHDSDDRLHEVNFFSENQYTSYLSGILTSFIPSRERMSAERLEEVLSSVPDILEEFHGDVLRDTVVIEHYYCTSTVHIPRSLRTSMTLVVAESGYIHSAGHAIYTRRSENADLKEFSSRLGQYLETRSTSEPVFLAPLNLALAASRGSALHARLARNGIDGLQLELEKHHLSGIPLGEALAEVGERFSGRIVVSNGASKYVNERSASGTTNESTIFLISDAGLLVTTEETIVRSRQYYLIAYAQYILNGNQSVLLKERKPGWIGPVTLPHTLSIAMVNLARSQWKRGAVPPVVLDPFCGTGTTLLDAAVRFPDATVIGLDRNPIVTSAVTVNLDFLGADDLSDLDGKITKLSTLLETYVDGEDHTVLATPIALLDAVRGGKLRNSGRPHSVERVFTDALILCLGELLSRDGDTVSAKIRVEDVLDRGFSERVQAALSEDKAQIFDKTIFYLIWRAIFNGRNSLRSNIDQIYVFILHEFQLFIQELVRLKQQSDWSGEIDLTKDGYKFCAGVSSMISTVASSTYRNIPFAILQNQEDIVRAAKDRTKGISVAKVSDSIETMSALKGLVDIVVCDPPYGFNTGGENSELQRVFSGLAVQAVDSLRDGGQLLVATPAFARNGRHIPFFETRGALTRQIISHVEMRGRRVVRTVRTTAGYPSLYGPPFYWQSRSALSRSILWFTIESDTVRS